MAIEFCRNINRNIFLRFTLLLVLTIARFPRPIE